MSVPPSLVRTLYSVVHAIDGDPTADAADRKLASVFRSALTSYGREPASGEELDALREGARLAGVELLPNAAKSPDEGVTCPKCGPDADIYFPHDGRGGLCDSCGARVDDSQLYDEDEDEDEDEPEPDDDAVRCFWGNKRSSPPLFVIVDHEWRVLGDGKTVDDAITAAHEYEHHDICKHCGHPQDEDDAAAVQGWRAFPISPRAHDLLTCGGEYTDALLGDAPDFIWAAEWNAFVWVAPVDCIACKGTGEVKPPPSGAIQRSKKRCTECDSGIVEMRPAVDWNEPPASACVWSGADAKGST